MIVRCYECATRKIRGCAACTNGFIDMDLIEGPIYVAKCLNESCGHADRETVIAKGLPPLPPEDLDYDGSVLECELCEFAAHWELSGWKAPTNNKS